MNRRNTERNREIAHHIFTGATTMVGVCITVIALFRAFKTSLKTYADELLGFNALLFLIAGILAYAVLRSENNQKLERWADGLFLVAMVLMLGAAVLILLSAY